LQRRAAVLAELDRVEDEMRLAHGLGNPREQERLGTSTVAAACFQTRFGYQLATNERFWM
jgi:hypothetical protein